MLLGKYVSILALAGMFSAVQAEEWTCVGSTFTPDESSPALAGGITGMTFGRLQFNPAATGMIEARCNITSPNPFPGWGHLEITHNDADGMGNATRVIVQLVEVNKFTGASNVMFSYNSDNFAAMTLRTLNVPNNWNFVNFAYYVNVQIVRNNVNQNSWLARVRLFD